MAVTKETNHAAQAKAKLITIFREQPNIAAIIDALVAQLQDSETVLFQLLDERDVDSAVGAQLDGIGTIVGEERGGRDDDNYRLGIKAQISKNVSSGTPEEMISITQLLVDNDFDLTEYYPAGLVIVLSDELVTDPVQVAGNIPAPAGVRSTIEYTVVDDDDTFTFASGDLSEDSTTQGFSAEGDEFFVAVGNTSGVDAYIVTSTGDGSWSEKANPQSRNLLSIASDGEKIVAGGNVYMIDSDDDAQTWADIAGAPTAGNEFRAMTYGNGLYVALEGNNADIYTSPDGSAWTLRSHPKSVGLRAVTWAGGLGLFVAVGNPDGVDAYIVTSPDGINWTEQANPKNTFLYSVCWSGTKLLAVGNKDGTDAYILTSVDGVNWLEQTNPLNIDLNACIWASFLGLFVAAGDAYGSGAYLLTSPDGSSWTQRSNPLNADLNAVAASTNIGKVVCVGDASGGDTYIISSADAISWAEESNPGNQNLNAMIVKAPAGGSFAGTEIISG